MRVFPTSLTADVTSEFAEDDWERGWLWHDIRCVCLMCVHDLFQFCAVAVYTIPDGIEFRAFRYKISKRLSKRNLPAHVPRMRKSNLEIRIVRSSGRP